MIVRHALDSDIRAVVHAMREADLREVFAVRWTTDLEHLVEELCERRLYAIGPFAFCDDAGAPIGIIGAWFVADGVAVVNMIATDRWRAIAGAATRWVKRTGIALMEASTRRCECKVWVDHAVSLAWLGRIGFATEGVHRAYGRDGSDFVTLAWVNPRPPAFLTGPRLTAAPAPDQFPLRPSIEECQPCV